MVTAVLYTRQSRTDDATRSASLDAQEADLRALADRRGWQVVRVFRDPDAPADALDRRTAWIQLLDHVEDHPVDVVAAFDTSRLWRSVELRYVMLRQLHAAGVATIATLAGDQTTDPHNDPEGGLVGTMLAAVSEYDNRLRSLKLRNTNREYARSGKPSFGGFRPYGYGDDRVTVVEHEAAVVREAARRVAVGESVGAICNDLTRRGVPTVAGGAWRTPVLRRLLTSPRTGGYREHDGTMYPADWEPLLDADEWKRMRAILLDPSRRGKGAGGGRPRAWLLTGGTAVCGAPTDSGACGAALVSRYQKKGRLYRCVDDRARGADGCGRIGIMADHLDSEVRDRIVARLDGDGLRKALAALQGDDRGGLVTELRATEQRLEVLEVDHYARRVSDRGYHASRELLVADIERLRTELRRVDHSKVLVDLLASERTLRDTWNATSTSVAWRRLVVAAVIRQVTVLPSAGGNRFNGDRVKVRWRV